MRNGACTTPSVRAAIDEAALLLADCAISTTERTRVRKQRGKGCFFLSLFLLSRQESFRLCFRLTILATEVLAIALMILERMRK